MRFAKHSKKVYHPYYPLAGGYSDIFIVPAKSIKEFAHYSGLFATGKLFVEFAIPTTMLLVADNISTEEDTRLKGKTLWTDPELAWFEVFNYDLDNLHQNFPQDVLYIHPVELSKWKITVSQKK